MNKHKCTYNKSGVNIAAADKFVKFISNISKKNKENKRFKNIGGFGSISSIPKNIKKPKIVASTDGVGTKIEIANVFNKYDTIGIDLVAMCVNDLIVQGAKPLLFLDYISINKIDLAPYVGASLEIMESDTKRMRGEKQFVFTNLKESIGVETIISFIVKEGML